MVAVTRLFVVVMREEVGLIMDGFTMVAVDTGWTKSASFGDRGKASAKGIKTDAFASLAFLLFFPRKHLLFRVPCEEDEHGELETVHSQCGASRVAHRA